MNEGISFDFIGVVEEVSVVILLELFFVDERPELLHRTVVQFLTTLKQPARHYLFL